MMKKKLICMTLAVTLTLTTAAWGTADEATADAFSGTWVCEDSEGYTVDIGYDEEEKAFDLSAVRLMNEKESYSIEFGKCEYDSGKNALVCTDGVLLHEADGGENEEDLSEETAKGFGAVLTIDGEKRLHWTGSGDAVADQIFMPLDEDPYTGDWASGNITINVDRAGAIYEIYVAQEVSEDEEISWIYYCTKDSETGALTGNGVKTTDISLENEEMLLEMSKQIEGDATIEMFKSTEEYKDGAVTFRIDGNALIWEDAKEDAGAGLRFERVAEEAEENEEDEEQNSEGA